MSQGALIFAFDNESIKYSAMADWSAERIRRWLNIPTTVITNQDISLEHADVINIDAPEDNGKRWFEDLNTTVSWRNKNRFNAYALSPYDETVLLDADYVINSSILKTVFGSNLSIAPIGRAYDITGLDSYENLNSFGNNQFPMSWATVVYFKKCNSARLVFDMMQMIQDNWEFYRHLYKINKSQYRNDFALSIAMNTVYGNRARWPVLPWNMASLDPGHHLTQLDTDQFEIKYVNHSKQLKRVVVDGLDFHAMGKHYLGGIIENS